MSGDEIYRLVPLTLSVIRDKCFEGDAKKSREIPAVWSMWLVQALRLNKVDAEKKDAEWPRGLQMEPKVFFSDLDGGPQKFQFARSAELQLLSRSSPLKPGSENPLVEGGSLNRKTYQLYVKTTNRGAEVFPLNGENAICMRGYTDGEFYVLQRESDKAIMFELIDTMSTEEIEEILRKRKK
jgi:hypothetical protein